MVMIITLLIPPKKHCPFSLHAKLQRLLEYITNILLVTTRYDLPDAGSTEPAHSTHMIVDEKLS
jgi:hypothetical protein